MAKQISSKNALGNLALELFPTRISGRVVPAKIAPEGVAVGGWDYNKDVAYIPIADTAKARMVRMHEAAHAIFSNPETGKELAGTLVGQALEDARLHLVCLKHVNDTDNSARRDELAAGYSGVRNVRRVVSMQRYHNALNRGSSELTLSQRSLFLTELLRSAAILRKGSSKTGDKLLTKVAGEFGKETREYLDEILSRISKGDLKNARNLIAKMMKGEPATPQMKRKAEAGEQGNDGNGKGQKGEGKVSKDSRNTKTESKGSGNAGTAQRQNVRENASSKSSQPSFNPPPVDHDTAEEENRQNGHSGSGKTRETEQKTDSQKGSKSNDGKEQSHDDAAANQESAGGSQASSEDKDGQPGTDSEAPTQSEERGEWDVPETSEPVIVPQEAKEVERQIKTASAADLKAELDLIRKMSRMDVDDVRVVEIGERELAEHLVEERKSASKYDKDVPAPKMFVHILNPDVPRKVKGRGGESYLPTSFGIRIRTNRLALAASNKATSARLFERRKQGGTVLIDASGSMGLSDQALYDIATIIPAGTVAYYSGKHDDWGHSFKSGDGLETEWIGHLVIYAHHGKIRQERKNEALPFRFLANLVDLNALMWLLKQPRPRWIVTDWGFTGTSTLREACKRMLKRAIQMGQVNQVETLEELRANMTQIVSGRKKRYSSGWETART